MNSRPSRRDILRYGAVGGALAAASPIACGPSVSDDEAMDALTAVAPASDATPFELDEISIVELGDAMVAGRLTARDVTEAYLARIETIDRSGPTLRSVIEVNPDALDIARDLDGARASGASGGPLHGIPILLKDNVGTADRMTTTAGSLALSGSVPPEDSTVARRLRETGAVLLGKANLSEWANFRSTRSSSGWSGRGGQCRNPYALDRNPCGSSSGSAVAVAANLTAVAIGTETDGSIVCPASANGIVGIKPTVGLVSRAGIIPISHSQDTAGPMARSVRDAAVVLSALAGADPRDPATADAGQRGLRDYTPFLDSGGLAEARIGVARRYFGFHEAVDRLMAESIDAMRASGAVIVDPTDLASSSPLATFGPSAAVGRAETDVLLYEFKADLDAYLATLGGNAPVRTLAELIDFNRRHARDEMAYFQQERFEAAAAKGPLSDQAYLSARDTARRLSRADGIDRVMDAHRLDAILAPTGGPAWVTDLINGDHFGGGSAAYAAVAGYPSITVPAGAVLGLPVGVSFFGRAWSEPTLIRIAFAFEQATRHRRPPRFLPTAEVPV